MHNPFTRKCPVCRGYETHVDRLEELLEHIRLRHPTVAHQYTYKKLMRMAVPVRSREDPSEPTWFRLFIWVCALSILAIIAYPLIAKIADTLF